MLHRLVCLPLLIAALALPLEAATPRHVEERRPIAADGSLSIELLSGSVKVVAGSRSEVEVTGTIGDDVEDVSVAGSEHHLRIEVELREAKHLDDVDADLEIRVPRGATVEIESVGADVTIEGISGAVRVESVHGDTQVAAGPAEINVTNVSGPIVVHGGDKLRELHLETVSGAIDFDGPLSRSGDYSLQSVSGSVTIDVEGSVSASFELSTFSGRIESSFGPKPKRESQYTPGTSLTFTEGEGDANVTVESFSGTIRLRKK